MKNLLLLFTVGALFIACQKDYYLEDLQNAESQIERLNSTVSDLNSKLNDANADITSLNSEVAGLLQDLTIANSTIESLEGDKQGLTDEVAVLEAEAMALVDNIESLSSELANANQSSADTIEGLEDTIVDLEAEILSLNIRVNDLQSQLPEPEVVAIQDNTPQSTSTVATADQRKNNFEAQMVAIGGHVFTGHSHGRTFRVHTTGFNNYITANEDYTSFTYWVFDFGQNSSYTVDTYSDYNGITFLSGGSTGSDGNTPTTTDTTSSEPTVISSVRAEDRWSWLEVDTGFDHNGDGDLLDVYNYFIQTLSDGNTQDYFETTNNNDANSSCSGGVVEAFGGYLSASDARNDGGSAANARTLTIDGTKVFNGSGCGLAPFDGDNDWFIVGSSIHNIDSHGYIRQTLTL